MKPPDEKKPDESSQFIKRSSLYQEFLAEREEILRHKWNLSEQEGKDVGFEKALLDWIRNHRDEWRNQRRQDTLKRRENAETTSPFARIAALRKDL